VKVSYYGQGFALETRRYEGPSAEARLPLEKQAISAASTRQILPSVPSGFSGYAMLTLQRPARPNPGTGRSARNKNFDSWQCYIGVKLHDPGRSVAPPHGLLGMSLEVWKQGMTDGPMFSLNRPLSSDERIGLARSEIGFAQSIDAPLTPGMYQTFMTIKTDGGRTLLTTAHLAYVPHTVVHSISQGTLPALDRPNWFLLDTKVPLIGSGALVPLPNYRQEISSGAAAVLWGYGCIPSEDSESSLALVGQLRKTDLSESRTIAIEAISQEPLAAKSSLECRIYAAQLPNDLTSGGWFWNPPDSLMPHDRFAREMPFRIWVKAGTQPSLM
jgi:hypothetical protein